MASPNLIAVAWSILSSLRRVAPPRPDGVGSADHALLGEALGTLARGQTTALPTALPVLEAYLQKMASVDPDALDPSEAKAFWINLYNGGALQLAARALAAGEDSVLRVPGAFSSPFITVAGTSLSLDDVEHAKVRRFGDPRIHAALVCGSVSCPTLRVEPFVGDAIDEQLEDQMRSFLAGGGAVPDSGAGVVHLSRVFSWFGSDFVRPHSMPTFLPARSTRVLQALEPWLEGESKELAGQGARVDFQSYDWGLRCSVG